MKVSLGLSVRKWALRDAQEELIKPFSKLALLFEQLLPQS